MNVYRHNFVTLALVAAVMRAGSISGGAKTLNLAVAAASKRLTDLEKELGVELFYRRQKGVEATEAGRILFQNILTIMDDLETLDRELEEFATGARGQVRVWANHGAISQQFPYDLAGFMKANPGIRIELEERDSPEIIKAIAENRADIGVFPESVDPTGLQTFFYRQEHLVIVVPDDHPLAGQQQATFAKALDYELVGLLRGTPLAARIEYESHSLHRTPALRIQVRSVEAMCRMISTGLGIGILPFEAVEQYTELMGLRTVSMTDSWATRNAVVGVRDAEVLPTAVGELLDWFLAASKRD
jgi:DNA-binding transcriptional LysR family regulator